MTEHVQINDVVPRVHYIADGVQRAFTYPFAIFKAADLEAWIDDVQPGSGFSVSNAGLTGGGAVIFDMPPSAGARVTLRRRLRLERVTDYQADGIIRAKTLNDEFDYQVAALQQVAEDVGRAIIQSPTSAAAIALTLPEPAAGRALKWDAAAGRLINSGADPDSQVVEASAQANAAQASAVLASEQAWAASGSAAAAAANANLAQNAAGNTIRGLAPERAPANWMLGALAGLDRLPEELMVGARVESGSGGSVYGLDLRGEHARVFSLTLNANLTLSITNPPVSGKVGTVLLLLKQDTSGGHSIAWPASVKWSGGMVPTADNAASRTNIYSLFTVDGGASWHGSLMSVGSR